MRNAVFFLLALFVLFFVKADRMLMGEKYDIIEKEQLEYSEKFKQAVKDSSKYLSQLEAQQQVSSIRYTQEKNVAVSDDDLIRSYIEDLALKMGKDGDPYGIQDILMHIPASVIIKYDGYELVTIDDKLTTAGNHYFSPSIGPLKPYTHTLPNGLILFFNLDSTLTLYDRNTNQYLQGTYETLKTIRDLSPLTSQEKFDAAKKNAIAKAIQRDLASAVSEHISETQYTDLQVEFYLPQDVESLTVDNVGFLSFMQGYPLPSGTLLNTYSFSSGTIHVGKKYFGVIRTDGQHMAYPEDVSLPVGSTIIETLVSEEEAARKGYFIYYKD